MSHLTEDEKVKLLASEERARLGLGPELQREWKDTLIGSGSEPLRFRIVEQNPQVILTIGARPETHPDCMAVFNASGERIISMDYDGVIASHVEDPIAEINKMLESKVCQQWEAGQLRAYLMLFRSYFSLPQPDAWKKRPML